MAKLSSLRTRNSTITLAESGTRLPDSPIALVATTRPSADHEVRRSERRFLLRLCGLDLRLCRQLHDPRALAGHEIVHFHNGPVGEFQRIMRFRIGIVPHCLSTALELNWPSATYLPLE